MVSVRGLPSVSRKVRVTTWLARLVGRVQMPRGESRDKAGSSESRTTSTTLSPALRDCSMAKNREAR